MRKRGSPFYGDTGTMFNGGAREDIEKQESSGAGHPGNDVDISQRYAQSEADEYTEQAEQMTRDMERDRRLGIPTDPEKRTEFVESLAETLRGKPARPAQPQEEQEEPSLTRKAQDKFFGDPEELKKAGRAVRPQKL